MRSLATVRMPEADDGSQILPNLFPSKLLDSCLATVQGMVLRAGARTERRAKLLLERDKSVYWPVGRVVDEIVIRVPNTSNRNFTFWNT